MSINLAIFASGRGSNLEAILKAIKDGKLTATVKAIVSNDPVAPSLNIARSYAIEPIVVSHKNISRHEHEKRIWEHLQDLTIDYIVLAGYMRIISPFLLSKFQDQRGYNRVTNIHPSLLPAFPGKDAYGDAFAYGVQTSGVTIHFVDEKVDHGPILAQESFKRQPEDSLEDFRARGLAVEHTLYPAILEQIVQDTIVIYPHTRG
jgi:phosphoribosylglycinamide formyltransferase-1